VRGRNGELFSVIVDVDDVVLDVLVLLSRATPDGTVDEDSHHEEHPEKNTDTATKNKCDSASLPAAQVHKGVMEPPREGGVRWVTVVFVVVRMRVLVVLSMLVISVRPFLLEQLVVSKGEWHDVN